LGTQLEIESVGARNALSVAPLLLALSGVTAVACWQAKAEEGDHPAEGGPSASAAEAAGQGGNSARRSRQLAGTAAGERASRSIFTGRGGRTLWVFMYSCCIVLAIQAFIFHFPGVGNHYNFDNTADSPLTRYVKGGVCVDRLGEEGTALCPPPLCANARRGNATYAAEWCESNPGGCEEQSAYDYAIDNCLGTCGCTERGDMFNPATKGAAGGADVACVKTGTCDALARKRENTISWVYMKWPKWIETHVVTGILIVCLGPLQFLRGARVWKSFKFHRWSSGGTLGFRFCPFDPRVTKSFGFLW
jgi:hypothetical protein